MMKIYLAASFGVRRRLEQEVAQPLRRADHEVTSRWLQADEGQPALGLVELKADLSAGIEPAQQCLDDIDRSDMVAVFTEETSSTGGYDFESGYAHGRGKQVVIIGPPRNVFHALPTIRRYEAPLDFLKACGCSV